MPVIIKLVTVHGNSHYTVLVITILMLDLMTAA